MRGSLDVNSESERETGANSNDPEVETQESGEDALAGGGAPSRERGLLAGSDIEPNEQCKPWLRGMAQTWRAGSGDRG